jgi:hypothetical protein
MATGHVLVELLDGADARHVAELFVHVVRATSRVVSDPDAKVLQHLTLLLDDLRGAALWLAKRNASAPSACLVNAQNLTIRALHISLHFNKVPETTLGHNFVWCEDACERRSSRVKHASNATRFSHKHQHRNTLVSNVRMR